MTDQKIPPVHIPQPLEVAQAITSAAVAGLGRTIADLGAALGAEQQAHAEARAAASKDAQQRRRENEGLAEKVDRLTRRQGLEDWAMNYAEAVDLIESLRQDVAAAREIAESLRRQIPMEPGTSITFPWEDKG